MKNIMLWCVLSILLVGFCFAIPGLLKVAFATEQPMLTVTSYSMWPVLTRGDLIFVDGSRRNPPEVGDIIVFSHQNGLAVHRIVDIRGTRIITKGDANTASDDPITTDDIIGTVPAIGKRPLKLPLIGHIALFFNGIETDDTDEPATDTAPEGSITHQFESSSRSTLMVFIPIALLVLVPTVELAMMATSGHKRRQRRQAYLKRREHAGKWRHSSRLKRALSF